MNDKKLTQWFINNVNGTPSEEQLALRKVYELQQRIDKAIEYCYKHSEYNDEYGLHYWNGDEYCSDYLLDILKGDKQWEKK